MYSATLGVLNTPFRFQRPVDVGKYDVVKLDLPVVERFKCSVNLLSIAMTQPVSWVMATSRCAECLPALYGIAPRSPAKSRLLDRCPTLTGRESYPCRSSSRRSSRPAQRTSAAPACAYSVPSQLLSRSPGVLEAKEVAISCPQRPHIAARVEWDSLRSCPVLLCVPYLSFGIHLVPAGTCYSALAFLRRPRRRGEPLVSSQK